MFFFTLQPPPFTTAFHHTPLPCVCLTMVNTRHSRCITSKHLTSSLHTSSLPSHACTSYHRQGLHGCISLASIETYIYILVLTYNQTLKEIVYIYHLILTVDPLLWKFMITVRLPNGDHESFKLHVPRNAGPSVFYLHFFLCQHFESSTMSFGSPW